jgi:acyl-CoA dehydrogenase
MFRETNDAGEHAAADGGGHVTMTETTLEQFTGEARAFLDAHAKPKAEAAEFVWGEGEDDPSLFEEEDRETERADLARAKAWRAKRFDAGLGWISGPPELGGRGLPGSYERAYAELEARYDVPNQRYFGIGLGMIAPTIADHATPVVAAELLPKMYRGDIVACQLFSEPGAGSDLASLQMRAEADGDEWIVTGQKVWTSGAHYADIGEVICRTDPEMPKHRGLTGFIVDMQAPGVEVRPLRQMTGGANFNEVFFNEVRVPDTHRLGDVNDGWRVALTTLMNERASIGGGLTGSGGFTRLLEMVRHFGLAGDPLIRQDLMDIYIRSQVLKYSNQRAVARMKAGQLPGPEMSGAKLALTENMRRMSALVSKVLGPKLAADTGEWGTYSWAGYVLGMPGMAIAGGSDQVLRNILGERVLGLPKEPGIDTTSPFKDLLVGTQRQP